LLFKNKYYLFTTWGFAGYRVSDDLITWKRIYFDDEARQILLQKSGTYQAAAVASDDKYMYFIETGLTKNSITPIARTSDPLSGKWVLCGYIEYAVLDPYFI
jgi:xylan 1,4-beta-xylosidase